MIVLMGAVTTGLILSLAAVGVFISFRILDFPDITADGSCALGGAAAAAWLASGGGPLAACLLALAGGAAAGALTGILNTRFSIRPILAGILMMTALYSVNLRVMGKSNIPLLDQPTVMTWAAQAAPGVLSQDGAVLAACLLAALLTAWLLSLFFRTHLGCAMRATGDNPRMIRALGGGTDALVVAG
ncbi:MAG: ABC transporter permease, partial [Elusimicrobia bacterium]|nr:ABC transporter permease [Elusimicrobiota bacterium]